MVKRGVTEYLQILDTDSAAFFDLEIDFLVVLDKAGNIRRVNPAFHAALGWSNQDVSGHGIMRFINIDDWAAFIRTFASIHPANVRMLRKGGGEVRAHYVNYRFRRGFGYLILRPLP